MKPCICDDLPREKPRLDSTGRLFCKPLSLGSSILSPGTNKINDLSLVDKLVSGPCRVDKSARKINDPETSGNTGPDMNPTRTPAAMPDYSRAEAILKAYGLPDAALRALALRWFDDRNPAHLLAALRHCEQVGRPPPWWLRQLLAAAMPPLVSSDDVRDWLRSFWVRYEIDRGETSWTNRAVYEYAAAKIGEHVSKPTVHKSHSPGNASLSAGRPSALSAHSDHRGRLAATAAARGPTTTVI